jgi:hypothetical protein
MKKISILFLFVCGVVFAQKNEPEFIVKPYLQDAEPTSIVIMWETSVGEESVVEWGKSPKLGQRSSGNSLDINFSDSRVHQVKLSGLQRFTEYYYRVKTGPLRSDIYQFKTPPFLEEAEPFNLIAMSDMQKDWQHPEKFQEIVNEGIITYMEKEYGGKLPDNLAMVLIPGDLVATGSNYDHWNQHFFKPSEKLFSQVPVYPVLGNHEQNSAFYFKYFTLPENGTPAFAEHWWYKDYGNVRVIGLNSNEGYRDSKYQFEWLQRVLEETAKNETIDFVFAQMHHPHKSELWIPGEAESSGKVVQMLEKFSEETGKPSLHFFGHTHGYSRGQSKEHKHLWINVASAGGAIDNWGEFEGRNYEEFTVTQDEYGFVMVSVDTDEANPKLTLKRISRGNNVVGKKENIVTDSITVHKNDNQPKIPKALLPNGNNEDFTNITLMASEFEGTQERAFHAASHWQISKSENFEKPVFDSWKQYQDWYFMKDLQADDDLTDEKANRLDPNTHYYWRVRYRDQYLNWSQWSEVQSFKTKPDEK